jgi:hypothetical protein
MRLREEAGALSGASNRPGVVQPRVPLLVRARTGARLFNRPGAYTRTGATAASRVSATTEPEALTRVIGDLNGDRKPDIATANGNNANTVSVLANRGDGSFAPKLDYRAAGGYSLAIGDLNGDGRLDLVTANYTDANTVSVLISTPGLCVVQDVRRTTLPVATRMLARVNCQVGEVGSDYSEAFASGLVMWQKPGALCG